MDKTGTPPQANWRTIGHATVKQYLLNAARGDKLSHAYLIIGPEQVGRKSLAYDIAKIRNCTNPDQVICADCDACRRIEQGTFADLSLISTETVPGSAGKTRKNISIEQIHQLRRSANLTPFAGAARIFIIDNAERFSREAATALLKTLEEPSASTTIILIAPTAEALPVTIVSRCQQIRLNEVSDPEIEQLIKQRAPQLESDEIQRLVRLAHGRPGWVINALADPGVLEQWEQATQRCVAMVQGNLHQRFSIADEIARNWRSNRAATIQELYRWSVWWRDAIMLKLNLQDALHDPNARTHNTITEQFSLRDLLQGVSAVTDARHALEYNATPRLAMEVLALNLPEVRPPSAS